jgi:hypothetical protein
VVEEFQTLVWCSLEQKPVEIAKDSGYTEMTVKSQRQGTAGPSFWKSDRELPGHKG